MDTPKKRKGKVCLISDKWYSDKQECLNDAVKYTDMDMADRNGGPFVVLEQRFNPFSIVINAS